jgi:DNA-binding GntR family transcriptional regulator
MVAFMPVSTKPTPLRKARAKKKPGTVGKPRKQKPAVAADKGVSKPSRFEQAYQDLKAGIMVGDYAPGQRLVEADLTRSLGVSRATIRTVLVRLNDEGLVDIEAKRGARVRSVTLDEALKILKVREVLEGLAASLAAVNATKKQVAALNRVIKDMAEAIVGDDLFRYTASNGRFHELILDAADHQGVRRALDALHFPLIRHRFRLVLVPGRKEESLIEHRKIAECIARGDAEGAERAMRTHVARVQAVLKGARDFLPFSG